MEDMGKELSKRLVENKWEKKYKEIIKKSLKDDDVQLFLRENKDRLSHQEILKGASKLYEFVDLKQKIAEGKEVFAPGYSPQLTISDHHIEVTYVPTKKLMEERRLREINNRINIVNLPKSIRKATLENYYRDDDGRMIALKKAIEFVANYTETPNIFHKGLYLSGSFGVGKTYLLGAIANKLAEKGVKVTLVHMPSFAVEIKNSIGKNTTMEKVDALKKAPVLMMDDIGADQLSSWFRDDVLGVILQYRMQEELPTFFSSNIALDDLEEFYLTQNTRGELEPLKAKRIMERIRFLVDEVVINGENRRNK
ncbi:primosomal protein DnaI [Ligilactobacillus salivarius]|uniref:Primosomal protein DnaI n=1 Tax=Ligilactobacillus salivarius TaxID=1624 RepID=A0AAW6Q300_9LACO|nr:primosomal protein DnaI [Ligilactobacillus salivarius]MDF4185903.1 primosomal protein DnaI [Ligilactobacillus salivarius]